MKFYKKHPIVSMIGIAVFVFAVTGFYYKNSQLKGYPITSDVFTTRDRTVIPVPVPSNSPKLNPYDISKFSQYGYGVWRFGKGLGFEKRLDIMPSTYEHASATNSAKLLNFFTMTDIHLTDKESPAEMVYYGYKWGVISGYSPAMLYTTQFLDAAVQTVNTLHKQNPFHFGISLGDDINSGQHNELRWFIDVLDGKKINPDSGIKDDPVPGPNNDYQDEFKAAGLDKTIPWYQTLGNHDHFWAGMFPPDAYIKNAIIGTELLNMGNVLDADRLGVKARGFYIGAIDGSTPNGDIIGAGPVADFKTPPTVSADPNRRFLSRNDWISEFFHTSSNPKGHGFSRANISTRFANYTFKPAANVPIKVIVLDDTQRDDNPDGYAYGRGALDQERYDWLVSELDKGQAEGKLMIIAAHIPIGVEVTAPNSELGWWTDPRNAVTLPNLIAELQNHPNLIMWIAGHRHLNTVKAFISPDPVNAPEKGFWQVETSSLRDFPQQMRTFEIYLNSDNTISIVTTNVDPAVKDGSLAATSRTYAIGAEQIVDADMYNSNPTNDPTIKPMPTASYNAQLIKQLSPEMQAKMKKLGDVSN